MMPEWKEQSQDLGITGEIYRYIARQPILDKRRKTYAYELLFRSGWTNSFIGDQKSMSNNTFDNAISFGLKSIVGDAIPFVNCSRDVILEGLPFLLPKGTVLEILESVEVDSELLERCVELRAAGYKLALDDYDFSDRWDLLLPLSDFVKVDMLASTPSQRKALRQRLNKTKTRLLAEKVENDEQFRMASQEGFEFFQGYFFAKPTVLARPALSAVLHRLSFMYELSQPDLDFNRVLRLLKEESSLSYKLLRLANSAAIGSRHRVTCLETALAVVGETQFRRMALVVLTSEISGNPTTETNRMILQKARFCELMANAVGEKPNSMYLFGMLAMVSSVIQMPPESLASGLNLDPDMVAAYSGQENVYSQVLECANSHTHGKWAALRESATKLGCREDDVAANALAATNWADTVVAEAA